MMSCSWAVSTLRRVESDLAPYHDGRLTLLEVLQTFSSSLELVYQELLVKDTLYGLTDDEMEACELIRCCMVTFRAICSMYRKLSPEKHLPKLRVVWDVQDLLSTQNNYPCS